MFAELESGRAGLRYATLFHGSIARGLLLFAGVAGVALCSGCTQEVRLPVFPVSGTVSFQGKPPIGAQVLLKPVAPIDVDGIVPIGTVKSDGSFTITTYDPDDGAPQGEYVALIRWFKLKPDGTPGANVLPNQYALAKASPVKVAVTGGPTVVPAIQIK